MTGLPAIDGASFGPDSLQQPRLETLRRSTVRFDAHAGVLDSNESDSLNDSRRNPLIRAFYQRLCQVGKAKKLALTACMRKLFTILNAMLKSRTPWRVAATLST